jgi:hypothetical protein
MCECNGKMIKGKKGHPMGRGPASMDRSRPSSANDAQPSKGTGEMNPGSSDKADNPSNPR